MLQTRLKSVNLLNQPLERKCAFQRTSKLLVRASEQQQDKKPKVPDKPPSKDKAQTRLDVVLEELKTSGLNTSKAKELLKAWDKAGVKDADQLRKLLVKRSLQPLTGTLLQALVDSIICFGGFNVASLASASDGFPSRLLFILAGNFVGLYYLFGIVLELGLAAAILYSTFKYGTSSTELLVAVRQVAGPASGLNIVDKASSVVNTLKVLQALEEVARLMQEMYGQSTGEARDSLKNLSAMLTLSRAKSDLGFDPEQYGLTEKQAGNVALAFSEFDLNDNGSLDISEIGNLCSSLGWRLEEAELKEAYMTLDADKDGKVDFKEFVDWWCLRCPLDKRP